MSHRRSKPIESEIPRPQLARLVSEVPRGEDWIHEIKQDGIRIFAIIREGEVRLFNRQHQDWTSRYPIVTEALTRLPVKSAILDGEVVAFNKDGVSDLRALRNSQREGSTQPLNYLVFDILELDGKDLTSRPLAERKECLSEAFKSDSTEVVRPTEFRQGGGQEFFEQACGLTLEGLISKRAQASYRSGRTGDWVKVKCFHRQEFLVIGYIKSDPEDEALPSAVLLAAYDKGRLRYVGKTGSGFTRESMQDIFQMLKPLQTAECPLSTPPRLKDVHWVQPELVTEILFTEWTQRKQLRHPSFQGIREDKPASEVVIETPIDLRDAVEERVAGVRLTQPHRILFPEQGVSKMDLATYYADFADWILPHLANRPLTLVRCPEGHKKGCFYQRHASETLVNENVERVQIQERSGIADYMIINNVAGLISLIQAGVLEFHVWPATRTRLECPDQVIFDLDPGPGLGWEDVVYCANDLRQLLDRLKLQSFVKLSGGKGVHLHLPIDPRYGWKEIQAFASAIAHALAELRPDRYTAQSRKSLREGRIFIDYLRNSRGNTAVAPYSTRARSGAPIAVPLAWNELTNDLRPDWFHIGNIRDRLKDRKDDPWKGIRDLRQRIPFLEKSQGRQANAVRQLA